MFYDISTDDYHNISDFPFKCNDVIDEKTIIDLDKWVIREEVSPYEWVAKRYLIDVWFKIHVGYHCDD